VLLFQQIASLKNLRWRGSGPQTEEGDGEASKGVAEKRSLEYHLVAEMEICLTVLVVKAIYCQTDMAMREKRAKVTGVGAVEQTISVSDKYSRIDVTAVNFFPSNMEEVAER